MKLGWGRGGLILYRTKVPAGALNGRSVLDIGEPVRDYAKVRRDPWACWACLFVLLVLITHAVPVSSTLAASQVQAGTNPIDLLNTGGPCMHCGP